MSVQLDRDHRDLIDVPRGLAGVAVTETSISDVRGAEGFYQYREHSATDLARTRTFEEVWHLFLFGELPDGSALERFRRSIAAAQSAGDVPSIVDLLWEARTDILHGAAAAWPILAARRGMRPVYDLTREQRREDALALVAVLPQLLTGLWQRRRGRDPQAQLADRGIVANYLHQLTGRIPTDDEERALTAYLVAVIDHGSTPRRSPRGSSPPPAPTSRRRSPAPSEPCPALCTAARPPVSSTRSTR